MGHSVKWIDKGRVARHPPDPRFPKGIDADLSGGKKYCFIKLQYPAPRVGQWSIECDKCGLTALITAAGRIDDPKSIRLACKEKQNTPVRSPNRLSLKW